MNSTIIFYGSPSNAGIVMPCKECKDRSPECHGSCEKYKAAKEKCDSTRDRLHKERSSYYICTEKKYRVRPTKRIEGNGND